MKGCGRVERGEGCFGYFVLYEEMMVWDRDKINGSNVDVVLKSVLFLILKVGYNEG